MKIYCVKCKKPVEVEETAIKTAKNGRKIAKGKCPVCESRVCKFVKEDDCE